MIQEFLTNNLIQITEDENVDKLLKASVSLEKKLTKNKSRIPTFVLIALDPEINPSNPDVIEVQQLVIDNWKTFITNCKDTPITYVRAIVLEALVKLSADMDNANLIWLSSKNILKYIKLKGKEKELIINFLIEIGNKIEATSVEKWSVSIGNKIQDLKVEIEKIAGVSINKDELKAHLLAASSHAPWGGGGENPHWVNQNNLDWPTFFSERAANGITEIINKALKQQNTHVIEIQSKIQEAIKVIVSQIITETLQRCNSLNIRTELLWWKEACYSSTLKSSYKEIPKGSLEIILAIDYSNFIPFIYPQSVNYFLKETHNEIILDEDKKVKLSEIFKLIDDKKELLRQHLIDMENDSERILLFEFVRGYLFDKYNIKKIRDLVGIAENTELTLSEFTIWLFHDVQVLNFLKK